MFNKKITFLSLMSVLCLTKVAMANGSLSALPQTGRLSLSATGTNIGIFDADGMLPMLGNQDAFLYGDFMGGGGTDSTYLMSPGLGYRQLVNNQIVGASFFADYERVSGGGNFWVLSPGVEWMNPQWDAHVNGYFPTEKSQTISDPLFYGDDFGDYSWVSYQEDTHNQYDQAATLYDIIGNGVDAEIGYSFSTMNHLRSRVYVGGYYYQAPGGNYVFSEPPQNITGVTGGIEQALSDNFRLRVMNSYDPVNLYTVGVTLTATFGGESNRFTNSARDRFLDPVERHVGIIATGAGTYDQEAYQNIGPTLEYTNVYFLSDGNMASSGTPDGTFGNPMPLNQSSLDTINAESPGDSRIYLQSGTDVIYNVDSSNATKTTGLIDSQSGLYVYSGQDFYGRSSDYTTPETVNIYVSNQTYDAFVTQGGNNLFSDLNISSVNTGANTNTGIYSSNTAGSEILEIVDTSISQFSRGIYANNGATAQDYTLTLTNVSASNNVKTSSTGGAAMAYGVFAQNESTGSFNLTAINSSFNNNQATYTTSSNSARAYGIYARNASSGSFNFTTINSSFDNNQATTNSNSAIAYGNAALNDSTGDFNYVAINSSYDNNHGTTGGIAGEGAGLYASNTAGNYSLTATNSSFDGNLGSGGSILNLGVGLFSYNGAGADTNFSINVANSTFNDNNTGMSVINNANMGITVTGSSFDNNATGLLLTNNNSTANSLLVTDLSGTTFSNNSAYGISGNVASPGTTSVNLAGVTFSGNTVNYNTSGGAANIDYLNPP